LFSAIFGWESGEKNENSKEIVIGFNEFNGCFSQAKNLIRVIR